MRWAAILLISLFASIIAHSAVAAGADAMTAKEYDAEGKRMYALGMHEEALQLLNNSIAADKNFAEAWYDKGNALCVLCRETEAEVAWERARTLMHEKAIISTPAKCCADITEVSSNLSESRSITWDFEVGNLRGWYVIGKAFEGQPKCKLSGDILSGLQGGCWISSDDNATGNLTSRPFRILGDRIDFLIGGCANCSISLIVDDAAAMTAYSNGTEIVQRVVWNVSAYKRKIAYLRLCDASSIPGGHLYFDDINFDVAPRPVDSTMLAPL